MPRKTTWKDRAEFLLARVVSGGVRALPAGAAERVGSGLGRVAHRPLCVRLSTVEENLRRAFPGATEEWVQRIARGSFEHLGREAVAMLRLSHLPPEVIIERTQMVGWDSFTEALRGGRGAILFTGHFGNWEVAAASVAARGIPIYAVAKRQRNRLFDRWINNARERLGIHTVEMREAPRRIPRLLRAGQVIGMVADQDARRSGVWVPFFGRLASTHRGPALFALRMQAPIFACSVTRIPGPVPYRADVRRVELPRTGDLERDVAELSRRLVAHLEETVRAAPEQYFWFHKRWKTRPPAELAPSAPGTTTGSCRVNLDDPNGNA